MINTINSFANVLSFLLVFSCMANVYGQDIIIGRDGKEIEAKVLEIGPNEIKYKRHDNLQGPVYTVLKSEISKIEYQNGLVDMFKQNLNDSYMSNGGVGNVCIQADLDADRFYTHDQQIYLYSIGSTCITGPLWGLIPAGIMAMTKPKESNLTPLHPELMSNPQYADCYKRKAGKKKKKAVINGYLTSVGVQVVAIIVLVAYLTGI